jgi:predicted membrane protein
MQMTDPNFSTSSAPRNRNATNGAIWGAIICVIGAALLLDHMGYVAIDRIWRYWPMLLVIGGVQNVIQSGTRAWGIVLLIAGILLQLGTLGVMHFSWGEVWPLLIIAAGGKMIWSSLESRKLRASPADGTATMNASAIFGGVERRFSTNDFRGGSINAIFGGAELDFVAADIQGDQAILEINAIFGGVEIRVPTNWTVENRGQAIFGGYSEATRTVDSSTDPNIRRKVLVITGTTLFGGVEIKN